MRLETGRALGSFETVLRLIETFEILNRKSLFLNLYPSIVNSGEHYETLRL